jgi:HEAT repeat protein
VDPPSPLVVELGSAAAPEPLSAFGPQLAQALTAHDVARARAIAERGLRAAITTGSPEERGLAIEALARVRGKASAPLLYLALDLVRDPDARRKAAAALAELAPPDAVPRLNIALAGAGRLLKVDIAAALYQLGDKGARPILLPALSRPGERRIAAVAMAMAGDTAARAALAELVPTTRRDTELWGLVLAGLVKLGDAATLALLRAELAQPDPARQVGAALVLARTGDPAAKEQLAQLATDPELARRGEAALALARLGDRRALGWVGTGLRSPDPEDRKQALAIGGLLGSRPGPEIAALANDPDPGVRMTVEAVALGL